MVNGEKAPPLLQLDTLLALGLDQRTWENALLNSKLTANLAAVLAEVGIDGCNNYVGNLLYAVAMKYPANALVHRPALISYILSMQIKNPAQLDAAFSFLTNLGPGSLDTGKFEEACGVGVVVPFEEIQSTVRGVITDNIEAILEQQYDNINVGSLCSQVQKRHPWGDAKAIEKEIKRRLAEILGPKAEAVEMKEKPAKVEEEIAAATAAPSSMEGLNLFNHGIGIRGSSICVDRLEYHTREELDKTASRSMVVLHPLKVVITNLEDGKVIYIDGKKWPDAPADEASSYYKIPFSNILYIEKTDFRLNDSKDYCGLVPGKSALLRHAFPIKCKGVIYGDDPDDIIEIQAEYDPSKTSKSKGVLHWVAQPAPGVEPLKVEIRLFEKLFLPENPFKLEDLLGDLNLHADEVVKEAYAVSSLATAALGDKFQFERLGYFAVDTDSTPQKLVFNRICCLNEVKSVNMQASETGTENREQRLEDLQQQIKLLRLQVVDLLHEKTRLENLLAASDSSIASGVKVKEHSDNEDEDLILKLLSCHDYFCCEKDQAAVLLVNQVADQVFVDLMVVPGAGPAKREHEVLSFIAKLVSLGMADVIYRLNLAGISLNGNFSELDFYWLRNKKVKLGLEIKARAQLKSDASVNKDYAALHKAVKNVFKAAVVRGTKFPKDFNTWLDLMASPEPSSKTFLIRYNISLMDELAKKNHFLTMFERFEGIIADEKEQNTVGVLRSEIVLAYIVAAECDWQNNLNDNSYVAKVHTRNNMDTGNLKTILPHGSIISRKKLLEKWRHSLVHLHEYDIEGGIIQYQDIHHVQMLESCVQGVFSQFQEGMHAIGEVEYPHLVASLKA